MARQHASGRRTVRERIERLFDPGSFHETGALAGTATDDDDGELSAFTPANMVCGQGEIEGRSAFRTAERFGVEEIIDPRDTRPLLCAWARQAHRLVAHEAGGGPKARGPRP